MSSRFARSETRWSSPSDERDVDPDYVELAVNEWDTYAVEEALRVKEATGDGEVVVVTVGSEEADEALRRCLAMGADRAIRVERADSGITDPLTTARALAVAVAPESPDLVFAGVQSSDSVQAATGTMLAELLDLASSGCRDEPRVRPRPGSVRPSTASSRAASSTSSRWTHLLCSRSRPGSTSRAMPPFGRSSRPTSKKIAVVDGLTDGEPAYQVRRMFVPPRGEGAEPLGDTPAAVAERIAEIVKARLS